MKHCMKLLLALLLALSLLATGRALGEEEIELGQAIEGLEGLDALDEPALEDPAPPAELTVDPLDSRIVSDSTVRLADGRVSPSISSSSS